ncbi:glucose-6-phosphate dehydrogenase [Ammoniphilus oxalaticus]|uniref:Glucose-6-phosphate 1-dehydrogenase n=1 Tax=Ammoniphilus oxalaticus TaxID=66863 RepID=A0A419SRK1_9BACL|nr:glucose-6-phosphate dehydrogenase [Ammoniphilus oxalaticus]RKD27051.1 glucose-6-phosphate dehydrogenase [Ammoniphilus oxalaticus]
MRLQTLKLDPATIILFGATGDLSRRKLFPALFNLFKREMLPPSFAIIGVARRDFSQETFREFVLQALKEFGGYQAHDEQQWNSFCAHLNYAQVNLTEAEHYEKLREVVEQRESEKDIPQNRAFYLAIAPELFSSVSANLKNSRLVETDGWKRLLIEKPFGHDRSSAEKLNREIRAVFEEEEIYRIDHYLGKEMVQNIEVIRFANSLFEPLWNNKYIANVQITSSETVGVEDRGGYYEQAGALRDMAQNHMLQMLMMIAMEPPSSLQKEATRDEKVKVLRSLRTYSVDEVKDHIIRGQYTRFGEYKGYREEEDVDPSSMTDTFVAARLFVDNFRWAGVPFYIRTGKRMPLKSTEIVVEFKNVPENLYFNQHGNLEPNLLSIRIFPYEGIYFKINAKKPGTDGSVSPIAVDFCQNCEGGVNSPEAYERLLHDCLGGDSTYFTRWDEVALAWDFIDPISTAFKEDKVELVSYSAGSWGPPKESHQLLEQNGFHWWPVGEQELPTIHFAKAPFFQVLQDQPNLES